MLLRTKSASEPRGSEITPQSIYLNRRRFMRAAGASAAGLALAPALGLSGASATAPDFADILKTAYGSDEDPTPFESVTTYNNFYEFGTGKEDPSENSGDFKPRPWTVAVEGEVEAADIYDVDDLIAPHRLEERIYRLRCVEGWSMVIPWVGVPLGDVIARLGPRAGAKYVAFETVVRPEEMPGQRRDALDWPNVEGLRIDEAMNPLTLLAVGLYGKELPNQNGAPIRLVVPWKYGFKSIKSIVRMSFVEHQPPNTWNVQTPNEYGFYSNVNPEVDHPRWSQSRERRIGEFRRRETLLFNGYGEEVADLYAGMDLTENF